MNNDVEEGWFIIMAKILIGGAGSSQSNGVINCLLRANEGDEIIGMGSDKYDLLLCRAHKKYLVPHSTKPEYKETLLRLIKKECPDWVHFNHDVELQVALRFRDEIEALGARLYVPDYETIDTCIYKYKSWLKFKAAGIAVPENLIINNKADLQKAFDELGDNEGNVWFRPMFVGNAARGAFKTNDFDEALETIVEAGPWGNYMAAEVLPGENVTWMALFNHGELIAAQGRKRAGWAYGSLSANGISGLTKIGVTYSSEQLDKIAEACCRAVSKEPHGVFGVDLKCDKNGIPNPTEINIARFFATVEFFAAAGFNMPNIAKNICLYNKYPKLDRKYNPLPDNLLWVRGMDVEPRLIREDDIDKELHRV